MRLFSLVESIMVKLSGFPGLQFIGRYVSEFQGRRTLSQHTINKYQGYVQTVRGVGSDVSNAARGEKKARGSDQDVKEVDEEEFEDIYDDDDEDETFMQ